MYIAATMITPKNNCDEFHLEFYQLQDLENAPVQIKMEKLKPKSLGEGGKKKEKPPILVSRGFKDQKISFTR
jgi:hypothetical protein